MNTFYSEEELRSLGIKQYGKNVYIGRHAILYNPEKLVIGHDVRIDDYTIISGVVKLGNYIHISHFCGLYGGNAGIEMGDYSALSSKGTVYAASDDYSGESMTNPMVPMEYKPGAVEKKVIIEKHAIIGAGSMVLPGVLIGEGAAIGSMSLCTKNIMPWSIYTGIPARKMRDRSKNILELEKTFSCSRLSDQHIVKE